MIVKYSKASEAVIKNKKSFFQENNDHLDYVLSVNSFYSQQPNRINCKNCEKQLGDVSFYSHQVGYTICENCTHFNGLHEDSEEFANFLYTDQKGQNYSKNYLKNYRNRVDDIYKPKVAFLLEVLRANNFNTKSINLLDIGCGAGHFIKACLESGINVTGLEPSISLCQFGNAALGEEKISHCNSNDVYDSILKSNDDVISLIGVLEHLRHPRKAIDAFKNSNAQYMYIQVPLFSLSVFIEHIHSDVFPRQLNAGHTHLYTRDSLYHLFDEFDLNIKGEWWFGTDFVDLFRHIVVKSQPKNDDIYKRSLSKFLKNHIDDLQHVLDKSKMCSGVNLIISNK